MGSLAYRHSWDVRAVLEALVKTAAAYAVGGLTQVVIWHIGWQAVPCVLAGAAILAYLEWRDRPKPKPPETTLEMLANLLKRKGLHQWDYESVLSSMQDEIQRLKEKGR